MDCLQETLVRDSPREVVSALGLRAAEDPVGTNVVPAVVGFREVDTHRVLDFEQRVVVVAIFRGLQAEAVYIRLVMFAVRIMMGHACGIIHAISVGKQNISGGTAPIEDPVRLEFQDQVLSSSGLVGMEDLCRQGRLQVVPLAWDRNLHQWLEAEDREDDHLLEAESLRCGDVATW